MKRFEVLNQVLNPLLIGLCVIWTNGGYARRFYNENLRVTNQGDILHNTTAIKEELSNKTNIAE